MIHSRIECPVCEERLYLPEHLPQDIENVVGIKIIVHKNIKVGYCSRITLKFHEECFFQVADEEMIQELLDTPFRKRFKFKWIEVDEERWNKVAGEDYMLADKIANFSHDSRFFLVRGKYGFRMNASSKITP